MFSIYYNTIEDYYGKTSQEKIINNNNFYIQK